MSPPLSSHTPASSASPMLFAADDNAPSTNGTSGPLSGTMLGVDNDPAFSDISSTCSGSPPPADFPSISTVVVPTITMADYSALLNGESITPPTPADSKAEKPKKRRQSKKAADQLIEVVDEKPDVKSLQTTPVTSRKRVSVGGVKSRESAATKRARLAAAHPNGVKKALKSKPKAKRAIIPSTLIVPRSFDELDENESIAVRVLAGLAHGVYE